MEDGLNEGDKKEERKIFVLKEKGIVPVDEVLSLLEAAENTGANVSGTIDSMKLLVEGFGRDKASPTMEDFNQLKDFATNLDAQFTGFKSQTIDLMKDNVEFLVAVADAKGTLPNHEKRLAKLEDDVERKRNWGVGIWGLAIGAFGVLFGCLAFLVAIGAWLLPR